MNTIEETKHAIATVNPKPFDVFLAEIFKAPEKKPDRKKEDKDNPDNNHHFTLKTLVLILILVVLVASLTAYIMIGVYFEHYLYRDLVINNHGPYSRLDQSR